MQIQNLFERNVFRPINGVVKAQQLDDFSVWQELDEFVFTKELDKYFRKFLSAFLDAIDRCNDPNVTGKMAVWIAGFFGSGIQDDAANRIVEFISVVWPKEHLDENLQFIADSIGPTTGEQPRETIRRHLTTGFYKHHLTMYKKRPIYWLFSSGKQRAFQCLVYLHRYNEGTLSRMRTEYVIPLMGKVSARLDQLEGRAKKSGLDGEKEGGDIGSAASPSHRKRLEKERDKLKKQRAELQAFDEKLRHYADLRISLDLDDGVKVNYGKFGDLLAEVKAVTGGKEED
jgi:hypothetical protein